MKIYTYIISKKSRVGTIWVKRGGYFTILGSLISIPTMFSSHQGQIVLIRMYEFLHA